MHPSHNIRNRRWSELAHIDKGYNNHTREVPPMTVQSFLRGSFVLALSIAVFGQTPKPPTPGSGGSPTPTIPSRPGSTPTNMPTNPDNMPNAGLIQRPILLLGKAMMDH